MDLKIEEHKKSKKPKQGLAKWYFPLVVLGVYISVYFFAPEKMTPILNSFYSLLVQIAPVFILVYTIMFLANLFIDNKGIQKYMGEDAGIKGWIISVLAGIISMGSIYAWYPLLKDLQSRGVKDKFLVVFLYNRGIKLQWLPVLLLYFDWVYSITLLMVMAVMSIFQGIITEKLIHLSDTRTGR